MASSTSFAPSWSRGSRRRERVSSARSTSTGSRRSSPARLPRPTRSNLSHVYCPECGFQNLESANYCSRCGALLVTEEVDHPTQTISIEDVEEEGGEALEELGVEGPALVVRSGGGRTGEQFSLERTQTTVGRTPDCDIF